MLKGILPSGESINLYTVDDVKRGIPEPFGRYAVWMPAEAAKTTASNWHKKKEFMENPLVIARAGTLEHIEAYFEKAKHTDGTVGNWHRFGEIDFQQPQAACSSSAIPLTYHSAATTVSTMMLVSSG